MLRTRIAFETALAAMIAALSFGSAATAQTPGRTVRGTVRDSVSGQAVSGAIVELVGQSLRNSTRTDQQGAFQFTRLPAGRFRLSVRQIGFVEATTDADVSERDVSVSISLAPATQRLDTVRVRANVTAVYGVVGSSAELRPVADAAVQIIGSQQKGTTDSTGNFFVSLKKGGSYFVRVRHGGFVDRFFPVVVPNDHAVETFVLLDSGSVATGADMLWDEFDERLRWQSRQGALVPGAEIAHWGGGTADAIRGSPSFVKKGLQLGSTVCLFVNGVPKPGWPLDAIPAEQIASVELYTTTGDETNTLAARWPHNAQCGTASGGVSSPTSPLNRRALVQYAVIWLKQP